MPIIKRYPNRKLYDTNTKRYVTLNEITAMIQDGEDVRVIDYESGDDLTTLTLTQIILEQEKQSAGFLPRNLLTNLIRTGGDTVEQVVRSLQVSHFLPGAETSDDDAGDDDPGAHDAHREQNGEAKSSVERAKEKADERLADVLHLINVPSRREVEALQVQLAILSQRLEEMLESHDEADDEENPASPGN